MHALTQKDDKIGGCRHYGYMESIFHKQQAGQIIPDVDVQRIMDSPITKQQHKAQEPDARLSDSQVTICTPGKISEYKYDCRSKRKSLQYGKQRKNGRCR